MGLICARLYKSIISDTSTSNMRINFDPQLPHMLCVNMYADVCMHGCVSPTCEVMFLYWWRASKALLRTVLRFCSNASNSSSSWSHCACEYRWVSNQLHCLNPTTQAFLTVSTVWFWWMDWRNSTAGSCPGGPVYHDDIPWTILTKATREFGWVNLPRSGGFCICEMSVPKPAPWIATNDAYKIKTHFLLNFVRHIVHINPRPPQATKATRCNWRISRQDNNVMWHRFALVLRIKDHISTWYLL